MFNKRLFETALRVLAAVTVHCKSPTVDDEQLLRAQTGNQELPVDELARIVIQTIRRGLAHEGAGDAAAVAIERYEFRTKGSGLLPEVGQE